MGICRLRLELLQEKFESIRVSSPMGICRLRRKQNQLKKVPILCGFRALKNAKSANHMNIISH